MEKRRLVVAAVIINGESVLLGQRPAGDRLSGQWEFPGGKVEEGETPEEALARELKEELGVTARAGARLMDVPVTRADGKAFLIAFYRAHIVSGEPKAIEEAQVKYVPVSDLSRLPLAEADAAFAAWLLNTSMEDKS